jgi:hypothetical protein
MRKCGRRSEKARPMHHDSVRRVTLNSATTDEIDTPPIANFGSKIRLMPLQFSKFEVCVRMDSKARGKSKLSG